MNKERYNSLPIERKAEFCAKLLDGGFSGYGDSCRLEKDGRYHLVCVAEETDIRQTPEELVADFERFYGDSERFWEEVRAL